MKLSRYSTALMLVVFLCAIFAGPARRERGSAFTASASGASGAFGLTHKLSSGLFGIPAGATSVDWAVVNNSADRQLIRVTVYKHNLVLGRSEVAPGPLVITLDPTRVAHNAGGVGAGQPFAPGFYYEVVLETDDLNVLPMVNFWQDSGNTPIPGTLIPASAFVEIK